MARGGLLARRKYKARRSGKGCGPKGRHFAAWEHQEPFLVFTDLWVGEALLTEARDAAKHLIMYTPAPSSENGLAPNVVGAEIQTVTSKGMLPHRAVERGPGSPRSASHAESTQPLAA